MAAKQTVLSDSHRYMNHRDFKRSAMIYKTIFITINLVKNIKKDAELIIDITNFLILLVMF